MNQLDLFNDYNGSNLTKDAVKPYLTKLKVAVLESLAANDNGASGSETAKDTNIIILNVRPTLTYLRDLSLIEDSGRRSKNERGNDEIVWQVTPFGKEALTW